MWNKKDTCERDMRYNDIKTKTLLPFYFSLAKSALNKRSYGLANIKMSVNEQHQSLVNVKMDECY